jgi:hypothetical protein
MELLINVETLRDDHFEPLAPCGGREAGIETHDLDRRVVIGGQKLFAFAPARMQFRPSSPTNTKNF